MTAAMTTDITAEIIDLRNKYKEARRKVKMGEITNSQYMSTVRPIEKAAKAIKPNGPIKDAFDIVMYDDLTFNLYLEKIK